MRQNTQTNEKLDQIIQRTIKMEYGYSEWNDLGQEIIDNINNDANN
jgi:hypothetical protein